MKKYWGYVPAIFCAGYYAVVCICTGRLGGVQLLWLALAGFFALFCRLYRRQRDQKAGASRKTKLALRICTVLFAAGLIFGGIAEGMILSAMAREPARSADYVLVLGAKVNGTVPSLSLRQRIDRAAAYLKENPQSKVIASGGRGADEGISEALAIAQELKAQGIDENRILLEDKSTSTEENLSFSMALLVSDGGSVNSPVVIVTSDFHIFRALRLAGRAGYGNVSGCAASSSVVLSPMNHLREILAVSYYFATGAL